ncbi:MAG: ATP-dependent sacrificial sulfur transferase LarE [Planctomycetaceae bacterium]|nr:ATP-dependent sacrificial sulfur transferase LarE [Planctomycetaceae bacterium]
MNSFDALPAELRQKLAAARESIAVLGRVVVAFSGGVDSTFLLALAVDVLGKDNVLAATGVSSSLAHREHDECIKLARHIGVELVEVPTAEMDNPQYAENPPDRCFHCKYELFQRLMEVGEMRGFEAIAAGANADDSGDWRPGIKAGRELGVVNPLMDAGLTKADIRKASQAMGLKTWNKPAMACLASRVPYGERLTPQRLGRIERAEYLLKDLGFVQCRVRDHDKIARIELPVEAMGLVMQARETIIDGLKALGYTYVTLDLQGFRSGSMNEVL